MESYDDSQFRLKKGHTADHYVFGVHTKLRDIHIPVVGNMILFTLV